MEKYILRLSLLCISTNSKTVIRLMYLSARITSSKPIYIIAVNMYQRFVASNIPTSCNFYYKSSPVRIYYLKSYTLMHSKDRVTYILFRFEFQTLLLLMFLRNSYAPYGFNSNILHHITKHSLH